VGAEAGEFEALRIVYFNFPEDVCQVLQGALPQRIEKFFPGIEMLEKPSVASKSRSPLPKGTMPFFAYSTASGSPLKSSNLRACSSCSYVPAKEALWLFWHPSSHALSCRAVFLGYGHLVQQGHRIIG